jgi:hypothetical protein
MSFFFIGLGMIAAGIFFLLRSIKHHDKEGKYGSIGLLMAGIVLLLFFGVFYRALILLGP